MTGALFDLEPHGTPCLICDQEACVCRAGGTLEAQPGAWPITRTTTPASASERTHRHATHGPCRTVCGRPCDSGRVVTSRDSERVTCPACLEGETFEHAAGAPIPYPR